MVGEAPRTCPPASSSSTTFLSGDQKQISMEIASRGMVVWLLRQQGFPTAWAQHVLGEQKGIPRGGKLSPRYMAGRWVCRNGLAPSSLPGQEQEVQGGAAVQRRGDCRSCAARIGDVIQLPKFIQAACLNASCFTCVYMQIYGMVWHGNICKCCQLL